MSGFSLYGRREAGVLSDAAYWKGTRDCVDFIQRLKRTRTLKGHHGCVNTIAWNSSGSQLVSGADDRHLKIYDACTGLELHSALSTHRSNIFSARFLPGSEGEGVRLVSCAGIGSVEYSHISPMGECTSHPFQCHRSITYQVATTPGDGNEFMTCEEKGYVRLYDLRVKSECSCDGCKKDVLYSFPASVSSMAVHPISPFYVAFGLGDGSIQVLDRRMIKSHTPSIPSPSSPSPSSPSPSLAAVHRTYSIGSQARKITSIQFNHDGSQLLASYSEDYVYLFNSRLFGCGGSGSGGSGEIPKPTYLSHCESYSPAVLRKRKGRVRVHTKPCGDADLSPGLENAAKSPSMGPQAVKKLRLRGDWSDTGPEACPEPEGSESHGRVLMNHMSHMFSQWIDMSLSSDEQEREGGGLGGARRRAYLRRRSGERSGRGSGVGGGSERSRLNSSSSSDNSFNLFDERDHPEAESGSSCETSNTSSDVSPHGNRGLAGERAEKGDGGGAKKRGEWRRKDQGEIGQRCDDEGEESKERVQRSKGKGQVCDDEGAESKERGQKSKEGCEDQREGTSEEGSKERGQRSKEGCEDQREGTRERGKSYEEGSKENLNFLESFAQKTSGSGECTKNDPIETRSTPNSAHHIEVPVALPNTDDESATSTLVESRTLNFTGEVPAINIIEDETDSDDDDDDDKKSHDPIRDLGIGSCDRKQPVADTADPVAADEAHLGGSHIRPFMVYKGHRNARTMIKQANFFGDSWVLSGSDCGRVFVWDKWTGEVVNMLMADKHVVNCIQPHPHAYLIATSGIDYDVKLWEPLDSERCSLHDLDKVMERNKVMLEESHNTITMPSMIFLRVLSYLNRRRRMRGEEGEEPGAGTAESGDAN